MIIIKIGGGERINIAGIIKDLANCDDKFIIVHGANSVRDKLAVDLQMPKKTLTSISGYSSVYSDEQAIDLLMMAYAGLKNKRIVELCQKHGINAIGLSGLDGKVIQGQRNNGIRIRENNKTRIIRDYSGKPRQINTALLTLLMDNGYTPVLCVPIIDENNFAINSENDDIVGLLQKAMNAEKIIQFIEAPGFLENPDDENTLVTNISNDDLAKREQQVEGRMKRKILALRKMLDGGSAEVIIADGRVENPLQEALSGKGTLVGC
jgi:acetylglutamate/LysW-gamma-L-alpha-aminoadipate kinase